MGNSLQDIIQQRESLLKTANENFVSEAQLILEDFLTNRNYQIFGGMGAWGFKDSEGNIVEEDLDTEISEIYELLNEDCYLFNGPLGMLLVKG